MCVLEVCASLSGFGFFDYEAEALACYYTVCFLGEVKRLHDAGFLVLADGVAETHFFKGHCAEDGDQGADIVEFRNKLLLLSCL